jgi:hypothetical protein
MEQIAFKSGTFLPFIATRSFALGAFNVTVALGSEIEFDGSVVNYAGATYTFPALRGAYKAGWIVLETEYDPSNAAYGRPVSANIKVHSPTDKNRTETTTSLTTEADERIVMSHADHAATTRNQNKQSSRISVVTNAGQEGVAVRTLKTSAKNERTELGSAKASAAIQQSNNLQIEPGQGMTAAEVLERMAPEEREVYLAEKAALKSLHYDESTEAKTVATVKTAKTTEKEGMTLKQSVGGGVEIADPTGRGGKAKTSTITEDGVTFKTTNGPERLKPEAHPRVANQHMVDARLKIAKTFCPDFPATYDFAAPARKKLARLQADFEDRPDVLRAVFAAESDDFQAQLLAEFPQAFQG